MLESYALVPLWQGHGVGLALFSYAGTVFWGINADYDVLPNVDEFATAIGAAFDDLHKAAVSGRRPESKARRKPTKRPPLGSV
jgi:hypothetical protein